MKHRLKNIRPPATPRLGMTITLTIIVGILAALTIIASNVASTTLPNVLKPYAGYSWPILCVLLVLGVIVATWQAWYNSGQSANNGTLPAPVSQSTAQTTGATPMSIPTSQTAQSTAPTSSHQTAQATTTTTQHSTPQATGATTSLQPTAQSSSSGPTPGIVASPSPTPVPGSAHYHTCMIGYSNKDTAFVNKLYTDLQARGVPCLLVDQDLKIGDKLREEIYRAVRQLDKLLLVLSEHAIASKWVEEAVDVALDRERQQPGTYLLFPLLLDDTVLDTEKYWAIAVRQRLIGNFTNWQQDAEYQQALQRVLRDLQA